MGPGTSPSGARRIPHVSRSPLPGVSSTARTPGAFLGLEDADCGPDAAIQVLPVPYEATVTWQRGTAQGPTALLAASAHVEWHDEWLDVEPRQWGIRTLDPFLFSGPPEALADPLQDWTDSCLNEGQFPFILGGEHSISLGPIRAAATRYPDLVVLHLDAHSDLRDSYEGTRFGHGCVMRRVLECGVHLHSFGIRAVSPEEINFFGKTDRATRVFARDLLALPPAERPALVLRHLPPGPLWMSFDVDGLDPSVMAATGTPEPGGVDWFTVSEVLCTLAKSKRKIVGADLVELSPRPGLHASDFAAARLAHRMLAAGLAHRS